MSFRKRNVVLSAAPPGRLPARGAPAAAAPAADTPAPAPAPAPPAAASTAATATAGPSLPPPDWPVAARMELPLEQQAALAPVKARLRRALDQARQQRQQQQHHHHQQHPLGPGARPSPRDGRPITSTGTASLDQLLAGYGGLLLGHALLVEEQGTTDFAGVVLRAYAAEGLVQGHHVHVLGFGPAWRAELPGLAGAAGAGATKQPAAVDADKMKIAWRYEALAQRPRTPAASTASGISTGAGAGASAGSAAVFCHTFDLTRRLAPADCKGTLHATPLPDPLRLADADAAAPFAVDTALHAFVQSVRAALAASPPAALHRVVLPHFLAPALYGLDGWTFPRVLHALLALRALLRAHPRRLTAVLALPTTLYDRGSAYGAALERLCDNVVELVPLPPGPPAAKKPASADSSSSSSASSSSPADKMQGWVRVHKVQVYSELGGLGASPQGRALRENLCFSVSASRGLEIAPYSLPPVEDDGGGGGGGSGGGPAAAQDAMAF